MEFNIVGLIVVGFASAALVIGSGSLLLRMGKLSSAVQGLLHALLKIGWLIPCVICALFFGAWLVQIVTPTLKGADFNQLYDLHGIRYLDITLVTFVIAFTWFAAININNTFLSRSR